MNKIDIRPLKLELRDKYKKLRKEMTREEKEYKDSQIYEKIISLNKYKNSSDFLCFVSLPSEIDTVSLLKHALASGKRVSAPKCMPDKKMEFFIIKSIDDLERASFSILEPKIDRCKKLENINLSNSVCIVPGLTFDVKGYRLGYGGGYYDRFLDKYEGYTVGICYSGFLRDILPHGKFDQPVDVVVTDKFTKTIKRKKLHP